MTAQHIQGSVIRCPNCQQDQFEIVELQKLKTILECCRCFKQIEIGPLGEGQVKEKE